MANALKDGIELQKYQADMFKAYNFDRNKAKEYIIALGYLSMGLKLYRVVSFCPCIMI